MNAASITVDVLKFAIILQGVTLVLVDQDIDLMLCDIVLVNIYLRNDYKEIFHPILISNLTFCYY